MARLVEALARNDAGLIYLRNDPFVDPAAPQAGAFISLSSTGSASTKPRHAVQKEEFPMIVDPR